MLQMNKKAKELVVNSDIFQAIITYTPHGIMVTDKMYKVILFNESAKKMTNIDEQAIIGKNLLEEIPQIRNQIKIDQDQYIFYVKFNDEDIQVKMFTVTNEDVKIFIMINVHEELKLNGELKKTKSINEELNEILNGSYDGVLVTDGEGNVLFVNQSYERITAIKRSEILGRNMRDLINPVWMPNSVAFVVMEQKSPVSKKQVTKEGKNIIVTGMPIFDRKGNVKKIVINARDITEIYNLREELLKSQHMEKIYKQNNVDLMNVKYNNDKQSVIAVSESMRKVFSLSNKVADFQATVLILGESGVGKEEVAKFIHNNSVRKEKPFITINCGAIPDNLLESELFGYEKGAFTGASQAGKAGLLEIADQGTVFLDEIGEISLDFQVKLLRFMETRQITRLGSVQSKTVDIRIIAATNRNLEERVKKKEFREDFYYRLNVVQIEVPPLRRRREDIGPMSMLFLARFNKKYNQNKILTYDVIKELSTYGWPGNVRELKNIIESMVVISSNEYLQLEDLPWRSSRGRTINKVIESIADCDEISMSEALEVLEKSMLEIAKNKYKTTREMAKHLGLNQSTVVRKLNKYNL